jgi:hypothetical protein
MPLDDERIEYAVRHTEILRFPKQTLATFGMTNIAYYLVTEPIYSELTGGADETVIRKGRVVADKPRIVTPYYLSRLEGFSSDAKRYFDMLIWKHGPDAPGLFYTYRNEPRGLTIASSSLSEVVEGLKKEIDDRNDPLTAIIRGQDELWDVSLMKFIHEITQSSMQQNLLQLGSKGLLDMDTGGVPMDARLRIEELFRMLARGDIKPGVLKEELERWDLFDEYQDRFLSMFRKQ